jgi:hypothetical protein
MIEVESVQPGHGASVRDFLRLPFRLYRSVAQWVPPIRSEAARQIDPRHNPFFRHSSAALLLARRDGLPVGRMAILDNTNYNRFNDAHTAFFALFECEDDASVARALFDEGFGWARRRGLTLFEGPQGFTAMDGLGLLVRGFEHRPAFGIPYHLPYYEALLLGVGFEPAGDILSGYLGPQVQFPERIHEVGRRVMERRGLRVGRFRSRRDLKRLAPQLGDLYNQSLGGTSGNVPLTPEEIDGIARQMVAFADPRLIKIVYKDDLPVGFLFAYPDISRAVRRTGGRLWPFGWALWLLELRRTKWVNINGAGIAEGYRGLGGTALLFSEMFKSVRDGGFRHADLVQIGSENFPMLRELRSLGVDFYKTHRLFRTVL